MRKKSKVFYGSMLAVAIALLQVSSAFAQVPIVSGKGNDSGETTLGNLVGDAVRKATGAEAAFVPASVLRGVEIRLDEIGNNSLHSLMIDPEEPLAIMELTGAQVREALERSLSMLPRSTNGFLQVSGLVVTYDPGRASGSRVTGVKVGDRDLETARIYKIAMPRSLATGGLGYFRVWKDSKPLTGDLGTLGTAVARLLSDMPSADSFKTTTRIKRG